MFSARIGGLLKQARQELALSRDELARRGRVSTRLIAELERGERPNVSLETTLHLLSVVGVTVVAHTPNGETAEMRSPAADAIARAARAAVRRATWKGRHVHLHDEDNEPPPPRSSSKRLASVSLVSKQAHLVATSGRGRKPATGRAKDADDLRRLNARGTRKKRKKR